MLLNYRFTPTLRAALSILVTAPIIAAGAVTDAAAQQIQLDISAAHAAAVDDSLSLFNGLTVETVAVADGGTVLENVDRALALGNPMDPTLFPEGGKVRLSHIALSGITQLNQSSVTIYGDGPYHQFGRDVATGDVNRDGPGGGAIGAPMATPIPTKGAAYLFFGPMASGTYSASQADVVFEGEYGSDKFGRVVGFLPDLDGDGAPELYVTTAASGIGGYGMGGVVYVFTSQAVVNHLGASLPLQAFDADLALFGDHTMQMLGSSVDHGDIDGDGAVDLVIGAPGDTQFAGAAYVVRDVRGWLGSRVSIALAATDSLLGASGDRAGTAVTVVGDMDHDGSDDLFVGAPHHHQNRGAAYYVQGSTYNGVGIPLSTAARVILTGMHPGHQLGKTLAAAGDPTRDGVVDLLVGAPGATGGGEVYLIAGRPANILPPWGTTVPVQVSAKAVIHSWTSPAKSVGESHMFASDFDGDGVEDIVVGVRVVDQTGPAAFWTHRPAAALYFP